MTKETRTWFCVRPCHEDS